ncbi:MULTISPECIES: hypothetical protein [unclassified Polaromonas]|uniref:hypothetical protein n=1 Tax=unclassified Polaromonas TaxID=2638319 RepID=UPI000F082EFE|nr:MULTISPECIES: hypothetical protein [unclassified Polaromonas]AYQ26575.1 hypothetical protein DT070_00090 [Polaromonas sp. SP1]QGJ18577.1 hypothetical protein F7R28_09350 [Polaromonas sp. Pch-P]
MPTFLLPLASFGGVQLDQVKQNLLKRGHMDDATRSGKSSDVDISTYAWLDHDSLDFPGAHVRALELFRDSVVRTSLLAVDREIDDNTQSEDEGAVFFESDLAELHHATVQGYLLTVQAMWERGLRRLLVTREKQLCGAECVGLLYKATWSKHAGTKGLQWHFERLLGLPMEAFDSYGDLDLLQNLGNAVRHGDGGSAKRVHELAPSLWWNWFPPGESYKAGPFEINIPTDWPKHPSFDKVTLSQAVLEQMIQSVLDFWEDLENVRCNSFRRKHDSVERRLAAWPNERALRRSTRVWTPS